LNPGSITDNTFRRMIKALLLIFLPIPTWEHIKAAQRSWVTILLMYFLPFLLLTAALEGYGLVQWGKPRGAISRLVNFTVCEAVAYETVQVVLTLAIVFFIASLIKSLGETFHGRHSFRQSFTVTAYAFGPLLLLRLLDAIPGLSPWLTWIIGVILCSSVLYYGLPMVMQPDPPHTFGLYMMSSLMIILITGLARFVTYFYLVGKFTKLDDLVAEICGRL
jgi:hypothetical protein